MSDALQALYAGDRPRALLLLADDDELSIFDAAAFGRVERLRQILEVDPAQARARSQDGFTALHLAIFGHQEAAVSLLIESGADLEALSTGDIARVPPLGTAVFVRSALLARLLLDAGADVNGRFADGSIALHSAAVSGDHELIGLLLQRGADRSITNRRGHRPYDVAKDERTRSLLA
ncbi:MAG: ankyrin repeat domain-containing protein [Chloroflexi bacterium]|nr:MAG: ankyrin repeat domain-containing protein [Chloroflexota bacterium]